MNWELRLRGKTKKTILRFSKQDQRRVRAVLDEIISDPYGGDIKKMKGDENTWRRRIGAYRIFYEIRAQEYILYVYRVERRTSRTY
jgi:mRNA interferase RelE/StbE